MVLAAVKRLRAKVVVQFENWPLSARPYPCHIWEMTKSYRSLAEMQEDLGGGYTTAAVRRGRYFSIKDLKLRERDSDTKYHETAAKKAGYQIAKTKRHRIKTRP